MGEFIHIDDRELNVLEIDISEAPGRIQRHGRDATIRGLRRINKEMTVDATGHPGNYFGVPGTEFDTGLEQHVSYQLMTELSGEVGIEAKGSGLLGGIIAKGSVNNAPAYDYMAGPYRALPDVVKEYGETAERSVLGDRA
jgi:hypothetical protein